MRRRGRPRSYDRAEVVEKAQALFWKGGAAGVSLDQLVEATGLHKPSLYRAFGGKRGLYVAALDAYIENGAPDLSGALSRSPLRAALDAFFEADLDLFCGTREGKLGCFLIGTAIDASAGDAEVRSKVEAVFDGLRRMLRERLERAADEGDLDEAANLDALTEILFAAHTTIAVEAKSGAPRAVLRRQVVSLLDFLVASTKRAR